MCCHLLNIYFYNKFSKKICMNNYQIQFLLTNSKLQLHHFHSSLLLLCKAIKNTIKYESLIFLKGKPAKNSNLDWIPKVKVSMRESIEHINKIILKHHHFLTVYAYSTVMQSLRQLSDQFNFNL